MSIKTKDEILNDLIADTVAQTNKITYFGKDGALRGIFSAIALGLHGAWADLFQVKRQIQTQTAVGEDLDARASRKGLTRKGATKSTTVLNFSGTAGTIIPSGTVVLSSVSGEEFITLEAITLGSRNSAIVRPIYSNLLADVVLAESVNKGSITAVSAGDLTVLQAPIAGVTVTNLLASTGGEDAETDEELRARIFEYPDKLAQGTEAFYEAISKEANASVLRAKAIFDPINYGIKLYVAKNSLGTFTADELTAVATYVSNNQRACNKVTCYNAEFVGVDIELFFSLESGYTFSTVYASIASAVAEFINPSLSEFGTTINYFNLFTKIAKIEGVLNIRNLLLNGLQSNVVLAPLQLPKVGALTCQDVNSAVNETATISQYFIVS